MARVSAVPAPGKFKSTEVKGAPLTMEIALDGADGITVKYLGSSRLQRELRQKGSITDRSWRHPQTNPDI